MTIDECTAFIRGHQRGEQEKWERMRWLMYTVAQVNSRKKITPESLFPFPWDKSDQSIEIDEQELEEARQRMKEIKI